MKHAMESGGAVSPKPDWKTVAFRYSLPVLTITAALLIQGTLQRFVPAKLDFPYAFFYLVAAFISAWYGGYAPGVLACLAVMIGFPLGAAHFAHIPSVDLNRLTLFIAVSALISRTAQVQRRAQEALRIANEKLDRSMQLEIAGHRKTEAVLSETEKRFEFAVEAAEMGRLEIDLTTGKVDRSPRHDQIFGYEGLQPEWSFDTLLEHILAEDRQAVADRFEKARQGGESCSFECRIRMPDREVRWISVRGRIRRGESGDRASMSGIIADITERKSSEQRLRTQLERLNLLDQITRAIGERQDLLSVFQVVVRTLEENLPVDFACVCLYDSAAEVLTVNCIGTRSEGLGAELALQPNSRIAIDRNGLSRCVHGELVYESDLTGVRFPFPERLVRAGLRAMVAAPLLVESKVFGVVLAARREPESFSSGECEFLRQLSEHVALAAHQNQIYSALQQAYDDLRQTQNTLMQQERLRALGQMASGVAHDINNALSPVTLYTELLLETESGLSDRARQHLGTIQRAISDVAHTVSRMRGFYRQQEPQLNLTPVDLGPLVHHVLDLTRARWSDIPQQRGLTVHLRVELAARLPMIAGVESEIREALTNLIFNALDAMPEGGTLTLRTRAPEARDGWVTVEVSDSGIGMDEETRKRCLEPFFTTKGERGTGLGLAMVYGVAQRHSAQIEIESAPGAGTIVRLRFPTVAAVPGFIQPDAPVQPPPRMRLLVVDDDPLLIKSLRDTLESDGHVVVTASGGKEGIDTFESALEDAEQQFAAVVTDLGMPHVDGRKVARAVKSASPATPVILLTGWGHRLIADGSIPPHVDRVLNKPPKLRELRSALTELTCQTGKAPGA